MPLPTPIIDLPTAIAIGLHPKGRSRIASGYVATSATTTVAHRATAYTEQSSDAQRSLASSSANDTAAGTGARTVRLVYFDASLNGPFEEIVTLNGTSRVATAGSNVCFIQCMEVLTAGNTGSNVGTVSIFTQVAGGSAFGSIAATDNRTYWAHHYVPTGMTAFIVELRSVSSSAVVGNHTLRVHNPVTGTAIQNPMGTIRFGTPTMTNWFAVPFIVPGPALVALFVRPEGTGATTWHALLSIVET